MDKSGKILGQHRGIQFYTIGQRRGIGIASKDILYVTDIDAEKNSVIVGRKEDIYSDECTVSCLNWIAIRKLSQALAAKVKIRSSHQASEAILIPFDNGKIKIRFREPQMAITPGQAAVFYQDDTVIGAGIID
jgi:tRNA-specific 2-thiouridylase